MNEPAQIRVLIVDDEPGARRRIDRLLQKEPDMEVIGQVGTGYHALEWINEQKPDLVFLDVQMPKMTGIEVVRNIGPDSMPAVVFVTAYDQYAVKAFELAALDYLMKPFDDERFEQTLSRIRQTINHKPNHGLADRLESLLETLHQSTEFEASTPKYIERIAVEVRGQLRIVPIKNIDYISASGNYVDLHVGNEKLLVREQMQKLEAKLPPKLFFRIHRSSIVRLSEIERLIVNPGGDYSVRLRNGKFLKVSRNRWGELAVRLGIETPINERTLK